MEGRAMLGRQERGRLELLVCGALRGLVPDDDVLARVDRVLDLGGLREEAPRGGRRSPRRGCRAAGDRP
jgi:hypothetical protein